MFKKALLSYLITMIVFTGAVFAADSTNQFLTLGTAAPISGGGKCNFKRQEFLANGTFTVPSGVTVLSLTGCAGGGGGYGGAWVCAGGGGGAGQGVVGFPCPVTPGSTHAVAIGAGGAGGSPGNTGGSTSFGTCLPPLLGGNPPAYYCIGGNGGGASACYHRTTGYNSHAPRPSGCGGDRVVMEGAGGFLNAPPGNALQVGYYVIGAGGSNAATVGNIYLTDGGASFYPGGSFSGYSGGGGGGLFGRGANGTQNAEANSCAGGGGGWSDLAGGYALAGGNGGSGRLIVEWCE